MGFKQHISRTWQMIEQQVNDVPFRPDNETFGQGNAEITCATETYRECSFVDSPKCSPKLPKVSPNSEREMCKSLLVAEKHY